MNLKDQMDLNLGREFIFYYLLDEPEWYCLIENNSTKLKTKKIRNGLFERLKACTVFVDKNEMHKTALSDSDATFLMYKTKTALRYLIDYMVNNDIDVVLFNGYCPVTIDELIEINECHIFDYFDKTYANFGKIQDHKVEAEQYMRLTLMLPNVYILVFEDDESIAVETKKDSMVVNHKIGHVFRSKEEAKSFIDKRGMSKYGIGFKYFRKYSSLYEMLENHCDLVSFDDKYMVPMKTLKVFEEYLY